MPFIPAPSKPGAMFVRNKDLKLNTNVNTKGENLPVDSVDDSNSEKDGARCSISSQKYNRSISVSSCQRLHHLHIESNSRESGTSYVKSSLSELKCSISDMKNASNNCSNVNFSEHSTGISGDSIPEKNISSEPLITYPESPPPSVDENTPKTSSSRSSISSSVSNDSSFSRDQSRQHYYFGRNGRSRITSSAWKFRKESISGSSVPEHLTVQYVDVKKDTSSSKSSMGTILHEELLKEDFDDLDTLSTLSKDEVHERISKYNDYLNRVVGNLNNGVWNEEEVPLFLNKIEEMMKKVSVIPEHGYEISNSLCNTLRDNGGIDFLISSCVSKNEAVQFGSAKILQHCLTPDNRAYIAENGLENVVHVACQCTRSNISIDHSRVSTGILENLFRHSESTCGNVIGLGGLDAILFECRKNDVQTLRHCAGALANLSLYGGADNQEAMIKRKVPVWLFPLAFHNDDSIKYFACLAIAALVANKEIEAAVLKSGTLNLVEPFVTTHSPSDFAKEHVQGQSKNWLQRLVPVLSSKREEARNLAAFHFCMEAGIKKAQNNTNVFYEIGAIEPLKRVASCPNAIASRFAAQTLRLIGEEVPHKLSQQVPLWTVEDVREWVKQISFSEYASNFVESRVDGDLLLQLTEDNLKNDIGITNGIRRRRFMRELLNLKKIADYSSKDVGNLNRFLQNIGPDFSIYTYSMLNAGVDKESIRCLSQEQLINECGIVNSIHRIRILDSIKAAENCFTDMFNNVFQQDLYKSLDAFISYRRSNGSQLASLLKVHLQVRSFSVFIDVERLEAGKFDNNLLQSIQQARNFLLVLTPNALDRCIGDVDCKDWVHKEIVAALQSDCNIIPVIDNFVWPEPEMLPEDMRAICHFNGIRWIHDYQDACVDKLERFMKGESSIKGTDNGDQQQQKIPWGGPKDETAVMKLPHFQRSASADSSREDNKVSV